MDITKDALLPNKFEPLVIELHKMIDNEMDKPDDQINSDTVKRCVDLLHSLEDYAVPNNEDIDMQLLMIKQQSKPKLARKFKHNILTKIAIAACMVLVIGVTNSVTAKAFNFNFINSVIEYGADFLKIKLDQSDKEFLSSEELSTELRSRFAQEGFEPLLPTYYSQKMKISEVKIDKLYQINMFDIILKSESTTFKIRINENKNSDNSFQIPNGECFEELKLINYTIYIVKIDNEYTACFTHDNTIYQLYMNCTHSEFIKILESIQ